MSSWITNGLKTLRIRVGGAVGSVSQQRQYGAEVKEVKVPERPKKPLTPYFRYLAQVRSEFQKQHPTLKPTELLKTIGKSWGGLTEATKQRYISEYKNDIVSYSSVLEQYKKSLTTEQKEAMHQIKLERELQREKRDKRKRLKELGKPKKPASPFFMYLANNISPGSGISEYTSTAKKLSADWKSMSDAEKAPYVNKYLENKATYEKSLVKWEDKMIKLGNEDLVRGTRIEEISRASRKK